MTKKKKQQQNPAAEGAEHHMPVLTIWHKTAAFFVVGTGIAILIGSAFVFMTLMNELKADGETHPTPALMAAEPAVIEIAQEGEVLDVQLSGKDMSLIIYDKESQYYHIYTYTYGTTEPVKLYSVTLK